MRYLFFNSFIFCFLFLIACHEKEEVVLPQSPEASPPNEAFKLQSILYITSDNSWVKESYLEQRPSLEYTNNTDVKQKIIIDPDNIMETSIFKSPEIPKYKLEDSEAITVGIPMFIDNQGNISLSEEKWPYSSIGAGLPSNLKFQDSIFAEPGKRTFVTLTIEHTRYTTSYEATLIGQESGDEVKIIGEWSGSYPIKVNIDYHFEDIK